MAGAGNGFPMLGSTVSARSPSAKIHAILPSAAPSPLPRRCPASCFARERALQRVDHAWKGLLNPARRCFGVDTGPGVVGLFEERCSEGPFFRRGFCRRVVALLRRPSITL